MQVKKILGIALAAALVGSIAVVAMPTAYAAEFEPSGHTFGVIGGFNSWGGDVAMTDDDGDGVYTGVVTTTGTYEFKVRADGAWDYSWGDYEAEYDRTQNSQTNFNVTVEEGQVLVVELDTNQVDARALANADSHVNESDFDFAEEGYDYWPVNFEVKAAEKEQVMPFTTLGVIGGFNDWGGDVAMTDDDGDGVYEATVDATGSFEFKVRADGAWDYSWGMYEAEYDRTQNSQTNLNVTLEEGQKMLVQLDTTVVDAAAAANADSRVNESDFDFAEEGFDYWPVSFLIITSGETEQGETGETGETEPSQTTGKVTVINDYIYFDNSYTKWDEVYAYWWEGGYGRTYDLEGNDYGWVEAVDEAGAPANHPVEFPGTKMTPIPGTDVWQARIPFGAEKIIFGSGKSDAQIQAGEIGYQTDDLSFDPVANAGQIYVVENGSEAKKGKGIEKTKYKYKKGAWETYTGAFVEEVLAGEPVSDPGENSQGGQTSGTEQSTVKPGDKPVTTGDSSMPIAIAVVAVAALGVALVASKKKSAE